VGVSGTQGAFRLIFGCSPADGVVTPCLPQGISAYPRLAAWINYTWIGVLA